VLSGDDATVNAWCGNQSLNGVLHRFFGPAPWVFARVVVIAVLGGIAVALLVRRMVADGRGFSALLVTALYGTLISPIAWTHHWCGR
jgi:alpha-1,2-mannosyltransferase